MNERSQFEPKPKNPLWRWVHHLEALPSKGLQEAQQPSYQEVSENDIFPVLPEVDLKPANANSDDAQTAVVNWAILF